MGLVEGRYGLNLTFSTENSLLQCKTLLTGPLFPYSIRLLIVLRMGVRTVWLHWLSIV